MTYRQAAELDAHVRKGGRHEALAINPQTAQRIRAYFVELQTGSGNITFDGATAMGSHTLTATSHSGGNIVLDSGASITSTASGDAITLATSSGNFTNNNSTGSPSISDASGRWLIYSHDMMDDTLGNISSDFNRYSCTYGGSCPSVPASGNGLLYAYTPYLTATPGPLAIIYGDSVPSLTGYGYTLSGYLGSDGSHDGITGSLNGITNYVQGNNVGNYAINYANGNLVSSMGYGFTYASSPSALVVNQATLTASLMGVIDKPYDGTTYATLGAGNYVLSGLYGADQVTLNAPQGGNYDTPNVGTGKLVSFSDLMLSGNKASNYRLVSNSISGNVGEIDIASIIVTANNETKYFAAPIPPLTYTYTGAYNGIVFSGALSTRATQWSVTGTYTIGQGTLSVGSDYSLTFIPGTLTIAPIPNTVIQTPVSLTQSAHAPEEPDERDSQTTEPDYSVQSFDKASPSANASPDGLIYADASLVSAFHLERADLTWANGIVSQSEQ